MKNSEAKILSGIAGEYFVAGELSRKGYIASITLRNTAGIDIIASNKLQVIRREELGPQLKAALHLSHK